MMKLSDKTLGVLKNYANINQGLMFKKGKVLKTVSSHKNILSEATISEDIPADFGIYDLNNFLSVMSLDQDNPDEYNSWYNIEDIDNENLTDESTIDSDDVIGDTESTFWYDNKGTTSHQTLPGEGFLGVSYYDSTFTDDRGYYNIQLPRNNVYRMSFYPPNADDDIGDHTPLSFDRYGITNINDAIAAFNFQSNKFKSVTGVDTLNAVEYFIGDVDGDDVFQLNDA